MFVAVWLCDFVNLCLTQTWCRCFYNWNILVCTNFGTYVHWNDSSRWFFGSSIFFSFCFCDLSKSLRWNPYNVQIKIVWLLWVDKAFWDHFLRGVLCKTVLFLRYCTYLWVCMTYQYFRREIQTSPKSNFSGFYGVNGPFSDYLTNIHDVESIYFQRYCT